MKKSSWYPYRTPNHVPIGGTGYDNERVKCSWLVQLDLTPEFCLLFDHFLYSECEMSYEIHKLQVSNPLGPLCTGWQTRTHPGDRVYFVNVTRLYSPLFVFPSNIEKGPSLRREVYSVAELRLKKMSRVLALAALTTLLLLAILSVRIGDCKSIRDRYVICGRLIRTLINELIDGITNLKAPNSSGPMSLPRSGQGAPRSRDDVTTILTTAPTRWGPPLWSGRRPSSPVPSGMPRGDADLTTITTERNSEEYPKSSRCPNFRRVEKYTTSWNYVYVLRPPNQYLTWKKHGSQRRRCHLRWDISARRPWRRLRTRVSPTLNWNRWPRQHASAHYGKTYKRLFSSYHPIFITPQSLNRKFAILVVAFMATFLHLAETKTVELRPGHRWVPPGSYKILDGMP